MSAVVRVISEFLFLGALTLVPGELLLRSIGFTSKRSIDRLLAALVTSVSFVSVSVTLLLLLHVYTRVTAGLVFLIPIAMWWRTRGAVAAAAAETGAADADEPEPIDGGMFAAAVLFLTVYFIDAVTSPMTWWDGLASWGKWAADWGQRTNSANYLVGGYPQLVPRLISVLYKFTGTGGDVLPLEFFAAHALHVWFCAWFVIAAARLMRLLRLPAWPAVLAGIGSMQFREHTGAGTVDVLVAAQVATLLALYLGWRKGRWSSRAPEFVLGASIAATLFTKATGIVGVLLVMGVHAAAGRSGTERAVVSAATFRRALLIGTLAVLPFVIEQGYTEARIASRRFDPYEVNLSVRQTPALLANDAQVTYRGGGLLARPGLVQLRLWNSYDVPATLRLVYTCFLVIVLACAATTWFGRATLPVLTAYIVIWLLWSSYDQRNLFPVLPVVAALATLGARTVWNWRPRSVVQPAVSLLVGTFLVLAGGSVLKDVQARGVSLARGDMALPNRVRAMSRGPGDRVATYFPQFEPEYLYLSALSDRTGAQHVLTTWPIFRFFPRGAHALSLWPYDRVRTGDLFCSHEWHRPPATQPWLLVARFPQHRVWLLTPELHPRQPDVSRATDGRTTWSYVPSNRDTAGKGYSTWEATLRAGTGATVVAFPPQSPVNGVVTSSVCDDPDDGGIVRCSGIIELAGADIPEPQPSFGVSARSNVDLLTFRVSGQP